MQTSNSLALYAWFIATLAGSHSFHLVRALSRSPSLDGAYIIYLRSKKVNNFENFFLHVFLVFRAFHVVLTLFWIISVDFIEILRFSCTEHQRKKGNPLEWHGCTSDVYVGYLEQGKRHGIIQNYSYKYITYNHFPPEWAFFSFFAFTWDLSFKSVI